VFGEPLADLESRSSVDLVVELESEFRLERLDVFRQPTRYVHDAFEQLAVGDVGEVDVDVDTKVGFGCRDLDPPLIAPGTTSNSIWSRGSELPIGPHDAANWSGSVKAR
jgi:hypothetical protein